MALFFCLDVYELLSVENFGGFSLLTLNVAETVFKLRNLNLITSVGS